MGAAVGVHPALRLAPVRVEGEEGASAEFCFPCRSSSGRAGLERMVQEALRDIGGAGPLGLSEAVASARDQVGLWEAELLMVEGRALSEPERLASGSLQRPSEQLHGRGQAALYSGGLRAEPVHKGSAVRRTADWDIWRARHQELTDEELQALLERERVERERLRREKEERERLERERLERERLERERLERERL